MLVLLVTTSEGPVRFELCSISFFPSYSCFPFVFQNCNDNKIMSISNQGSSEVKMGIFPLSIILKHFWATEFPIGKLHFTTLFSLVFVKGLT